MAFLEQPRFPENLSAGSRFGPGYSTRQARNQGGYRAANRNWTYPLHRGDVARAVNSQSELNDLLAFFHGAAGMFNGFRFKNFNDYTVTGSQGTLIAIDSTHWQMAKTRTYGALSTQWKVTKPLAGAVIAGSGSYSYSTITGIITKASGADPSGWTGEFDFPVQFNIDEMLPEWIAYELYNWSSIPIVELRP